MAKLGHGFQVQKARRFNNGLFVFNLNKWHFPEEGDNVFVILCYRSVMEKGLISKANRYFIDYEPSGQKVREKWLCLRKIIETKYRARRGMPGNQNGNGRIVNALFAMEDITGHFKKLARLICPMGALEARLPLSLTEQTIVSSKIRPELDGFRILHLSDIHFDGGRPLVDRLASCVKGIEVDLVVMTGDYRKETRGKLQKPIIVDQLSEVLGGIHTRYGVVATLGNHDPHEMAERLEAIGVKVLTNQTTLLNHGGQKFCITGIDDPSWHFTKVAKRALQVIPSDTFGLVLVHTPELAYQAARCGYDVYFGGHTHGGQIRQLLRLLPQQHRGRASGAWQVGDMKGYTSNGVGVSSWPIRHGAPAEVTVHTLCAA